MPNDSDEARHTHVISPRPTPPDDTRFTDDDLKNDPSLIKLADSYLADYDGDFEFLVMAQGVAEEGPLPIALVRGVLNVMRNDPAGRDLVPENHRPLLPAEPEPEPESIPYIPPPSSPVSLSATATKITPARVSTATVTATPQQPASSSARVRRNRALIDGTRKDRARQQPNMPADGRIPAKLQLKAVWLYSTHASSSVAHLIDKPRSRAYLLTETKQMVYLIEALCKRPRYPARFLKVSVEPPEDYDECPKCLEAQLLLEQEAQQIT